jgi:uncharacterized protein (TIGR02594 family)
MRALGVICLLFLASCSYSSTDKPPTTPVPSSTWWSPKSNDNPLITAAHYLGFSETTHRAELREYTGVDPVRTEWCAAFVNSVLEESGIPSNKNHKYPLTARAFLDWGIKVSKDNIQGGDIVVFPRGNQGWQGHVGLYVRSQVINGVEYYWILGGNQNNKVSVELYPASKALGIRRSST